MHTVNVTAFRQSLPRYLALAQRGERVQVTSRGVVIVELGPAPAPARTVEKARALLKGSVRRYVDPTGPVLEAQEWEAYR